VPKAFQLLQDYSASCVLGPGRRELEWRDWTMPWTGANLAESGRAKHSIGHLKLLEQYQVELDFELDLELEPSPSPGRSGVDA
jgi:hypothetical protein